MQVGFYGKLPSHGDFLRRRVSEGFVDAWDAWLRDCLTSSHVALGARWLDVYLTSPAWRFVCAGGACGPTPIIGLLAPSVDRVGRYFPLTLVAELPADVSLVSVATGGGRFFDAAERLVIETLAAERVDFERFDQGVMALGEELTALTRPPGLVLDPGVLQLLKGDAEAWHVPLASSSRLGAAFEQLVSFQLEEKHAPLVLWWTDGSSIVEPSCLIARGLPEAALYPAFLNGSWTAHGWRAVAAHAVEEPTLTGILDELVPLSFRSAAATDIGCARGNNEDGFLERPESGIWVVADGMGGHSHGEVASRMVCDALADFQPDGTFDAAIAAASRRVEEVNDHLLRSSNSTQPADRSGTTVVMLFLRGQQSAILWAGDSRVYRWRDGQLEQLSRDHSLAELAGPGAAASSVITRAVGVLPNLTLDIQRDTVRPADRFLLCSDGLTRVIPDARISALMAAQDIRGAVDGLIKATLEAGAPDNVTVLIAEAYR